MTEVSNNQPNAAVCDWTRLLSVVSGNDDVAAVIVKTFIDEIPTRMSDIEKAIDDGDGPALHRRAHTLKSSLNIFGAARAVAIVLAIETAGKESDFTAAPKLAGELKAELVKIDQAIHDRWLRK